MRRKNIVIIGATGSIGENTLEVIKAHPDSFRLLGIAANQDREGLAQIAQDFSVPHTSLFVEDGIEGINTLSTLPEADIIVMAATGTICLIPTLKALDLNKTVALASKEVLVLAGELVMEKVRSGNGKILPVDSEHNAIFQCLQAFPDPTTVAKIILTASGGPFRTYSKAQMETITTEEALKHPNWEMGPKITIDSATLANKGLEMIEAMWLFNLKPEQIDVVVHPQSIIHSMVQGIDGSIIAQLGPPSMTFPIQNVLTFPERISASANPLSISEISSLDFESPDEERFPCLRLAKLAMKRGGIAPLIFNSANNVAVAHFAAKKIPFLAIPQLIDHCLTHFKSNPPITVEDIIQLESQVTTFAESHLQTLFQLNA